DARPQMGHFDGCVCFDWRHVQQLCVGPGCRPDRPGRHLHSRLSSRSAEPDARDPHPPRQDNGRGDPELIPVLEGLAAGFESVTWEISHGQDVAQVPAEEWFAFANAAKEAGFEICADVTAVDWMRARPLRFQVIVNL